MKLEAPKESVDSLESFPEHWIILLEEEYEVYMLVSI